MKRLSRPSRPALKVAGLSLLAGLAAALAHPPFGLLPGLLGYALLLWMLDGVQGERPLRSAFWRGWLAGVAYFTVGVWWVVEAFLVDAKSHGWMAPFAIIFMAAGLGAFWGLGALAYRRLGATGWRRVLVFAACLSLSEWLRGKLLFPWNLPGETWRAGGMPSQAASLIGAYGMTWLTLAIAAAPVLWADKGQRRTAKAATAVAAAALLALYGFGAARLAGAATASAPGPTIRIVQADVEQSAKYDEAYFESIVDRYVALTAKPAPKRPDIVVWPEGALPAAVADYLAEGTWTRKAILGALSPGQTLILGGFRVDGPSEDPDYYNSLFVLRRTATGIAATGVYDKHTLVPFGEFLPLEDLIEPLGIKQLVKVGDGFTPGPAPTPLSKAGVPSVLPLICYESLFPSFAWRWNGPRAAWIVNISNDAWFGRTSGPWQHLNLASYRSIEEGLPMIRSTPTGVSAIIDAYGRVSDGHLLTLGQTGVIDGVLPSPLPKTPYSRLGDTVFWIIIVYALSLSVRHFVRSVKTS